MQDTITNLKKSYADYMQKNPKAKKQIKNIKELIVLVFIFLCLRSSVFGNYRIPTASMVPTIKVGDHIFANKLAYSLKIPFTKKHIIRWGTPQRGDVVSFKYPLEESIDYTKRIVGLPGDRISMKNGILTINGQTLKLTPVGTENEKGEVYDVYKENLLGVNHLVRYFNKDTAERIGSYSMNYKEVNNFPERVVPANCYFAMGDNRDNSSDSRVWGFVPLENIDGRLGFRWIHIETKQIRSYLYTISKVSFDGFGLLRNEKP